MNNKTNRKQIGLLNIVSDAVIVFLSYFIAMYLRYTVFNGTVAVDLLESRIMLMVALLSIIVAVSYQAYKRSYLTIVVANAIGTLAVMAIFFVYRITDFSRWSLVIFWLISSALVIAKHALGHRMVKAYYGNHKTVLVGTGETADRYLAECDKPFAQCSVEELQSLLEEGDVDDLVIALEPSEAEKIPFVLQLADKDGLYVSLVPFFSKYIPVHPEIESFGQTKLINLRSTPLGNFGNALIKRLADVLGSIIAIVLTSPLMLMAVIGVKISSPGPILFKQERVGKDKKNFNMLKFRSMKVNTEENTAWSKDTDPRRTKFGSFIRKYSIDELPQFFNVLKGDMSLVGPRPEIPFYVYRFRETVPLYLVRQQVRPGITGWAQVNGLRGDTSIEERVEYDIWYIENWSVLLDLKILFSTVFGGKFKNSEK